MANPPAKSAESHEKDAPDNETRILNIGNLHYHGNDLAELRKLAEVSPELAEKLIDQRDREDQRDHASYRFGLGATIFLVLGALVCLTFMFVYVGPWSTVAVIGVLLAIALLLRVILTGQWSETSWIGRFLNALIQLLGGEPISKSDDGVK